MYDQEPGADSERLVVLGATGAGKINAQRKPSTRHWKQTASSMMTGKRLFLQMLRTSFPATVLAENNPLNQDKLLGIESLNVSTRRFISLIMTPVPSTLSRPIRSMRTTTNSFPATICLKG